MGRSGQRRAQQNEPFYKKIHRKLSPHTYLENKLILFEKLDNNARQLWSDFQSYLADEREKVLDQIIDTLLKSTQENYANQNYGRIIGSKFSATPLSSKGSYLVPPGGRFNFGQSISYQTYFPALYIASEYEVAFAEKFHISQDFISKDGLTALDLSLRKPESFSYQRVNFMLDRVLDLRNDNAINSFYEVIKHIKMPKIYQEQAKRLKQNMNLIPNCEMLKASIFDPNYEQWDFWLEQPSPSQWFGHYVRLAGIQGLIYPSVRTKSGHNMAIYLDQFEDSQCFIQLSDENFVQKDQVKVDSTNYLSFI